MGIQLCNDVLSINRAIADDANRTLHIDHSGRPPAGCRSSIDDQIKCVARLAPNFFSGRRRRHTFTVRTGAGERPDSLQELTQWLPSTETDADRASPRRDRVGKSKRCREDNGKRSGPEGIHQHRGGRWDVSNEWVQLRPFSNQHKNRLSLRPAFDLPQLWSACSLNGSTVSP